MLRKKIIVVNQLAVSLLGQVCDRSIVIGPAVAWLIYDVIGAAAATADDDLSVPEVGLNYHLSVLPDY